MQDTKKSHPGFTLIELLVVIAIIGLLASTVLSSLSTARAKARDSERMTVLRELQKAVELYRLQNGSYPTTGGAWWGHNSSPTVACYGDRGLGSTGYVPGIVPTYLSALPEEKLPASDQTCYLYNSNGTDYKLLIHQTYEACNPGSCPLQDAPRVSQRSGSLFSIGAANW